ncbi:putative carboxymethylenebutenolidase [Aquitalea magnusonii]|uniref:Putative carboxymethylenebutenolidase n=1 Tax=Aquitalea magnusonii TaxID=332411 RepID=A0A3G9GK37_9NEIS|nr:dienelactone hydrolase family protein [Aquitalea magnusonii]BBF85867.1 putative carboxymethylenebutenolidase [Aquitalea magnusonii]
MQAFDPPRRDFIKGALATGFALAVQPVTASIITDTLSLDTGLAGIALDDGILPAYFARPTGQADALPIVLVVQEIFGVHEHIRDICRRLAKRGYLAIAPELYFRQGNPAEASDIATIISTIVSKVADQQVMQDLDATLAWAGLHGGDVKRTAITGFCWGGRITWLYASHNPDLKAGIAWYGKLVGEHGTLTPSQPVDIATTLKVPVLGLYGGQDGSIPQDSVNSMRSALQQGSSASQIVVYPQAGHAFNADYRPSYNAAAAQDGWQRMLTWLDSHGMAAH